MICQGLPLCGSPIVAVSGQAGWVAVSGQAGWVAVSGQAGSQYQVRQAVFLFLSGSRAPSSSKNAYPSLRACKMLRISRSLSRICNVFLTKMDTLLPVTYYEYSLPDLLLLAHTTTDHPPTPNSPPRSAAARTYDKQNTTTPKTALHDLLPPAHTTNRTAPSAKTALHDLLPPAHTTNRTPPSPKSARPICYSSRTNHRNKGDLMV